MASSNRLRQRAAPGPTLASISFSGCSAAPAALATGVLTAPFLPYFASLLPRRRGPLAVVVGSSVAFACLTACGEELLDPAELTLNTGQEADALTRSPAPDRFALVRLASTGEQALASGGPGATLVLDRFGEEAPLEVRGFAGDAEVLVGRSIPVNPRAVAGQLVPLFVSRKGELARPPAGFTAALPKEAQVAVLGGRYVLAAFGDGAQIGTRAYDLGGWASVPSSPSFSCGKTSCTVRSFAVVSSSLVLAIGEDFAAFYDFEDGATGTLPVPTPLKSWAEVAGGRAFSLQDGSVLIVGATRATEPTRAVVHLATDGAVTGRTLLSARAGAAVASVQGRGLLVVGGSATGAGAELLPEGADAFTALPFEPDPTHGAALLPVDDVTVVRIGGRDGQNAAATTATLELGCATACAPKALSGSKPLALDEAVALPLSDGSTLLVGTQGGATRAFHGSASTAHAFTAVPLREARAGALALLLPTGHGAILGGGDSTSLELILR